MCLFIFPVGVAQLNFNFMSSVAVTVIAGHCLLYRFLSNSDIYSRKFLIITDRTPYHYRCRQADYILRVLRVPRHACLCVIISKPKQTKIMHEKNTF